MRTVIIAAILALAAQSAAAQQLITNVYGRSHTLLNGKWDAIVDQYDQGRRMRIMENRVPRSDEEFYEYSFTGGLRLNVPGDWNSQDPGLDRYEGTVWYARHLSLEKKPGVRQIVYFEAVSYRCSVYLNGEKVGEHEGSFTPFQVDITDKIADGDNFLVVEVNNRRDIDAIPAMSYDWWNYGGITRNVLLVELPDTHIASYAVRLDKRQPDLIHAQATLSTAKEGNEVTVTIPELKLTLKLTTDATGKASGSATVKNLERWSPEKPKLYGVTLSAATDTVSELIGFRNIEVDGTKIYLNGRETFLRCVSFHEEIAQRGGRAFSESDAETLLGAAKDLGVNTVRLAHYPQNEYIVRRAEQMGIMLWEEIPVWQSIDFGNAGTLAKAQTMLREMIARDVNRCAVSMWGVANETKPSPERDAFLTSLLETGKEMDTTRLYVAAFDVAYYDEAEDKFVMRDAFTRKLDLVGINKYMGWYAPWPKDPAAIDWDVAADKPLVISEFGGEALYGQSGDENVASSWSEDYQAKLYRDNLEMFANIPNLAGVSPWVLFDFRSPFRFHPTNQQGWNRKGLLSDQGMKKRAWYIMRDYYKKKEEEYNKK